MTDTRDLIQRLVDGIDALTSHGEVEPGRRLLLTVDVEHLEELATEARAYLAAPEPATGPAEEEWEAVKERLWDQFRTVGYQGEQFVYDLDFDAALDGVRQALARCGHHPPQPIPLSERLPIQPGPTDWCWDPMPAVDGWFAVIKCYEVEEGMFPAAVWVKGGKWAEADDGGMTTDGSGHAGPFAARKEAEDWGYAHDPEGHSWQSRPTQ